MILPAETPGQRQRRLSAVSGRPWQPRLQRTGSHRRAPAGVDVPTPRAPRTADAPAASGDGHQRGPLAPRAGGLLTLRLSEEQYWRGPRSLGCRPAAVAAGAGVNEEVLEDEVKEVPLSLCWTLEKALWLSTFQRIVGLGYRTWSGSLFPHPRAAWESGKKVPGREAALAKARI